MRIMIHQRGTHSASADQLSHAEHFSRDSASLSSRTFGHPAIQGEFSSLRCRIRHWLTLSRAGRSLPLPRRLIATLPTKPKPHWLQTMVLLPRLGGLHGEQSPATTWCPLGESRCIVISRPGRPDLALVVGALDIRKGKVTHVYETARKM